MKNSDWIELNIPGIFLVLEEGDRRNYRDYRHIGGWSRVRRLVDNRSVILSDILNLICSVAQTEETVDMYVTFINNCYTTAAEGRLSLMSVCTYLYVLVTVYNRNRCEANLNFFLMRDNEIPCYCLSDTWYLCV